MVGRPRRCKRKKGGVVPEKHFYFAVGATVGAAISVVIAKKRHTLRETSRFFQWLYRKEPHWFLYFPIVIFMVGLWGLIPDIIHFLGWLPKEITRTHLFDVFFLHTTFEYIENTMPVIDSYLNFTGQLLLAVVCIGTMIFYVGQVKKAVLTSAKNSKEG
jgi:hypothetical protein